MRTIPRIVPAKTVAHSDDFRSEDRTVLDTELPKRFAEGTHHEKDKRKQAPTPQNVIPFTKPRAIAALAAANPSAVVVHKKDALVDAPTSVRTPILREPPPVATKIMSAAPAPSAPPATRVATGWTPPNGVQRPASPVPAQPVHTVYPQPPQTVIAPPWAPPTPPQVMAPAVTPAQIAPQLPQPVPMPPPMPVAPPAPAPYAAYDQLGLGAPKAATQGAAKLVVSAYRLLGFAILTIIVIVLVGYIAQTMFFYFSDSWAVPMSVTPSDERVVSLQAQLAEQQNARDKVADELAQAERAIAAQQEFQLEYGKAIKSDLEGRKSALGRVRELANAAANTRSSIRNANNAYAGASRKKMAEEYQAGLIDRQAMLTGKFQLAQISSSNLSLAERQAEFETRAQELEAQARSLEAILANASAGDTALSYDVLKIKQEYEASRLELAKAIENRNTLKASLDRQDKIVKSLQQSAYLRALHDQATIVSVPYGNLSHVDKGASLYSCRLGMLICHHVGEVLEVLPGEVQFKHPHRDKELRGQMVEVKLDADEGDATASDVLFVGGKPMLL